MRSLLKSSLMLLPRSLRDPLHRAAIVCAHAGILDEGVSIEAARVLASQVHTLAHAYGGARSIASRRCLNAAGEPIPWFTYPAIEYLDAFDFSQAQVFEYGSGSSTLWWAHRAASVTSVEHNPTWANEARSMVPPTCTLILETDREMYPRAIEQRPGSYDVIVVDGMNPEVRWCCIELALPRLAPKGLLVLDNADWMPEHCAYLRDAGLIEVPFAGFHPLNAMPGLTTIFLTRNVAFKRKAPRDPLLPVGGKPPARKWRIPAVSTSTAGLFAGRT